METSTYEQQAIEFLESTNTKLDIKYKEFGPMPWDNDGQQRNIYLVTLSNANGEYRFDFGSSVIESCGMEPKLSTLKESDKISLYAGVKHISKHNINSGISFTLTKEQLLNTDYFLLESYFDELEETINLNTDAKNKKVYESYEKGNISRNERDGKIIGSVDRGIVEQTIQNVIKRKIKELTEEMVYSKELKGDTENMPSAYDVLTCITKYDPCSFEDFCSDFGYDNDSRKAEETYNSVMEDWEQISTLFDDEQLELLREIQ